MIGIYKITNKINGKFYIGQSIDIKRRFMEHKCPHGTMSSIKLAIKKYGKENFSFEVIEECEAELLDEREMYWIARLNPQYNRNEGGGGCKGFRLSPEIRKRISQKNKQYWNQLPDDKKEKIQERLCGPPKGHKVSEETRAKLRAANLGKKQSAETVDKRKATIAKKKLSGYVQTNSGHKKKVRCVETNQIFESVKAAGNAFSVPPSSISAVLKGHYQTCKGNRFEYVV